MRYTALLVLVSAVLTGCSQGKMSPNSGGPAKKTIRVAGVVLKWIAADKERNYRRAEVMIREAAAQGAQLVVTTECFLDGYAIRNKSIPIEDWRALGEKIPGGKYLKRLQKLADQLDIYLIAGMLERDGNQTYNAAVLIDTKGKLIGKYRKQHLGHEAVRNSAGSSNPVFDTPWGKIGIMICADRRYPEVAQQLRQNGADFIVCPSGGMWGPKDNDHFLQTRSQENNLPIVFVHPIEFLVTGPDGSILDCRLVGDKMSINTDRINTKKDKKSVAIYQLQIR
ncbi:MAG: carbon-nitrogen hydrolase family protein [Planctomycetota bacterium]